jgi:hypothetical protein
LSRNNIVPVALVEAGEGVEDSHNSTGGTPYRDDGRHVAVLNLCTLVDRHPPALLVLLNTRHDVGETEAGVREVLEDALEEGQHLLVGLVAVQDALGSQLDPSRPPPGA